MRVSSVSIVLMSSAIGYDTTNEKNRVWVHSLQLTRLRPIYEITSRLYKNKIHFLFVLMKKQFNAILVKKYYTPTTQDMVKFVKAFHVMYVDIVKSNSIINPLIPVTKKTANLDQWLNRQL